MTGDIDVRIEGRAGRITLNRPKVLNALSHEMVNAIALALDAWVNDPAVFLVVIDAIGGRAFCAGGDVQLLYHTGRGEPERGRQFWFDEYRLNARIHHYPKPYVALMDGIVMGGGVGISAHGSHRIVTERSSVTMPEASIGFMPDVGGTRLLADAPGETGLHLGLTASRMSPGDAIHAGFADRFARSDRLPELVTALVQSGEVSAVKDFCEAPPESELAAHQVEIDACYAMPTLLGMVDALGQGEGAFAREALQALRRVSPFSAMATFEAIRRARQTSGIEACLINEYRFAYRSLDGDDFYEGIRAAVIDKDRTPRWHPARIEDVSAESIADVFAPLGEHEWRPAI